MEVTAVTRWIASSLIVPLLLVAAQPGKAALLSLTIIGGLTAADGSTVIPEGIAQESLSGSTLTQLGSPLLYDLNGISPWNITARLMNTSDLDIAFPDLMPGVSVMTGLYALPGYTTHTNVAAGGAAGKSGLPGADGVISSTTLDFDLPLDVTTSAVVGSNGGGGGAGTGIGQTWIAATGASGADLALYLAGITLHPGQWIDIVNFARVTSFGRGDPAARIALGFDIPTFSFGGVTITTGAWTGSFSGPGPDGTGGTPPPPPPPGAPEPGSLGMAAAGLAIVLTQRCRGRHPLAKGR